VTLDIVVYGCGVSSLMYCSVIHDAYELGAMMLAQDDAEVGDV